MPLDLSKYPPSRPAMRGVVDTTILPSMFPGEDEHADILDSLADGSHYDLVQLDPVSDPDLVGLLVNGRLRVTYRKDRVYQPGSRVAESLVEKAAGIAYKANATVRSFNRGVRGSTGMVSATRATEVSSGMGEGATEATEPPVNYDWEPVEAKEFTTPEVSDEQLPGNIVSDLPDLTERTKFDPATLRPVEQPKIVAVINDDEVDALPSFLKDVIGGATAHNVDDLTNGW